MHSRQIVKIAALVFALSFAFGACAGVGTTTGKYVDDSVITTKVKSKLLEDPQTSGLSISVTTDDGVVHLTGLVDSQKEKARAETLAKQVNGAKLVKNELAVK